MAPRRLSSSQTLTLWHLRRSLIVSNCCNVSAGCYLLWREFSKQSYHGQHALAWGSGTFCPWAGGSDPWLWNCLWTWTFQLPPDSSQKGENNSGVHSSITLTLTDLPPFFSFFSAFLAIVTTYLPPFLKQTLRKPWILSVGLINSILCDISLFSALT